MKAYTVDLKTETISPPVTVRANLIQTVQDFKEILSDYLRVPAEEIRCVLERHHCDLRLLSVPAKTLKAEGFFKSNKVGETWNEMLGSL